MRLARRYIPLAGLALALGLAGCASGPGSGTSTSTPTPSPTVTPVCPVGDWRSTQVAASASGGGAALTVQGGSGVTLAVAPDGAVRADFSSMQPITFTAQVAVVQANGEFTYAGPITGGINLAGGASASASASSSASPGAGASGTATPSPGATGGTGTGRPWEPVGTANVADLRVTIKITAPASVTIADNVKVSEITSAQTTQIGNAIDLQPLLRPGTYDCAGEQLAITLSGGQAPPVTWTFARA
jgi:hypothetical protein